MNSKIRFSLLLTVLGINILFAISPPAVVQGRISLLASCDTYLGGTWDHANSICTISISTLNAPVRIDSWFHLIIDDPHVLENHGTIENHGIIENYGIIENVQPNPVTVDLDGDGDREVIAPLGTGYGWKPRGVWVFDLESGQEVWRYSTGPGVTSVAVADLDGDGKM